MRNVNLTVKRLNPTTVTDQEKPPDGRRRQFVTSYLLTLDNICVGRDVTEYRSPAACDAGRCVSVLKPQVLPNRPAVLSEDFRLSAEISRYISHPAFFIFLSVKYLPLWCLRGRDSQVKRHVEKGRHLNSLASSRTVTLHFTARSDWFKKRKKEKREPVKSKSIGNKCRTESWVAWSVLNFRLSL